MRILPAVFFCSQIFHVRFQHCFSGCSVIFDRYLDFSRKNTDGPLDFCKTPRTRQEIADFLGVKTVFYAMQHYVKPLLDSGLLRMTIPDKPKSSKQMYYAVDQ